MRTGLGLGKASTSPDRDDRHAPRAPDGETALQAGKKVLFVSSTPTHPTNSGNRARVLGLVQAVERLGHEVHFAFVGKLPLNVDPVMAERFGKRLHVLGYRPRRTLQWAMEHARRRVLQALGSEAGYRWSLDAWYDEQLTPMLRSLQAGERFDAVVVEYVYMSRALEAFGPDVQRIIDTHDRFTDRHRPFRSQGQGYEWFSLTEADERRGLSRADSVIAIQADEGAAFASMLQGASRVEIIGHVVDTSLSVERARDASALMVASANVINVEAANHFIDHVLPRVLHEMPSFRLLLAGDVCQHVPDAPGVVKLGRVDDLPAAYGRAALAVNPVRGGTGLCIKSLETMALGVPLVTTRSGARGLERYQRDAFVAVDNDDAVAMAQHILGMLRDPERADQLARNARAAALEFNERQLAGIRAVLQRHAADPMRKTR